MLTTIERDLNDVLVFTKVVQERSFSAAARALGLPNSTVSRRVARLEDQLGVRLLHRTTRKLSLTDAGQLYYERGVLALSGLEEAENILAHARTTPRGRVKVIAPVEPAISTGLATQFLELYPEVRIDMEFSSREANIIHEGYDVAIYPGLPSNQSVVAHKLMDSPFHIVASPGYLDRRGEPATVAELADHECVIFGPATTGATWILPGNGDAARIPVHGRIAVNHLQAVRQAAIAGLGIALLPAIACSRDIAEGTLRIVLEGITPDPAAIYISYPSGRYLAPAVRLFIDYVKENFREVAEAMTRPPGQKSRKKSAKKRRSRKKR